MSISTYNCEKGCCQIYIQQYDGDAFFSPNKHRKKAGAFIYDPENKKVLLVQSRGQFWGFHFLYQWHCCWSFLEETFLYDLPGVPWDQASWEACRWVKFGLV